MEKPILVDDIRKDFGDTQEEVSVVIDGAKLTGWQIAKPLNLDKEYTTQKERNKMAKLVKEGKAIAVQFFSDLTEDEKVQYVKEKMEQANENVDDRTLEVNKNPHKDK